MIRGSSRKELEKAATLIGRLCSRMNPANAIRRLGKAALRLLATHAQVKASRAAVLAWALAMPAWQLAEHLLEAALLPVGVQGTVTVYVSSVDGDNADNGSTWALANGDVAGGLADANDATFNFIYVDSAHSFSSGAAITWNGTAGSFTAIISVDRNGSTTTGHNGWLAGADETVGVNVAAFNIANSGSQNLYFFGLTLSGNSGAAGGNSFNICTATTTTHAEATFESCTIIAPGSNAAAQILIGCQQAAAEGARFVRLKNCVMTTKSSTSGAGIMLRYVELEWIATTHAFAGSKSPLLFAFTGGTRTDLRVIDSDLTGFDAGNYFDVGSFNSGSVLLQNVKLHATPGLVTGTWPTNRGSITLVNSDSGDTHNVFEYRNRLGTITEVADNYANSGAQFDGAGISWQIVTTASCSEQEPFMTPWIHRWTTATGSQDLHLQLIRDSATDYTNREVWGEFECLESASFPNGTLTSTRNAQPFDGTGVDLTNSSDVWTETLTNDNEMECRVTRTVAEKSLARARLFVGVASTTLYLDPALRIGSQGANPSTRWSAEGAFNAEPASGGAASMMRPVAQSGGLV